MKQFVNDMINLTEGQKLIKCWWLWLGIIIIVLSIKIYSKVSHKKQWNKTELLLFKESSPKTNHTLNADDIKTDKLKADQITVGRFPAGKDD